MQTILNSMKKISSVFNVNSFETKIEKLNNQEIIVYPSLPDSHTKNIIFNFNNDGNTTITINRNSKLTIKRDIKDFINADISFLTHDLNLGIGYNKPQFIDLMPIITSCNELECKRYKNNCTIIAKFLYKGIELLMDFNDENIKYSIQGTKNSKFNTVMHETNNIKNIYNICKTIETTAKLTVHEFNALIKNSASCEFLETKFIKFAFKNGEEFNIRYSNTHQEWILVYKKQESIINDPIKLEEKISEIIKGC